jgi:SAM-dependent methyltransferase
VLSRARRKASAAGLGIAFLQGFADELRSGEPFAPASFGKAVSSLMFHHLPSAAKRRTLANLRALLGEKGELHIADWGKPGNALMRALFLPVQLLDGFETTADNVRGRLPAFMRAAGFKDVEETQRWATPFGSLSFYRARKA